MFPTYDQIIPWGQLWPVMFLMSRWYTTIFDGLVFLCRTFMKMQCSAKTDKSQVWAHTPTILCRINCAGVPACPACYQSTISQNPRMLTAAAFYFLLISAIGRTASDCPADSLECPDVVGKTSVKKSLEMDIWPLIFKFCILFSIGFLCRKNETHCSGYFLLLWCWW